MKIALKYTEFDEWDVSPAITHITVLNRNDVAVELEKKAVPVNVFPGISAYEAYERIAKELAANPDRILYLDTGAKSGALVKRIFFFYKKHLHLKHIPAMYITDVDTSRPWMISSGAPETVVYPEKTGNNQIIIDDLPF